MNLRYTSPVNPETTDLFAGIWFDATGYARYYTAAAGSAYHTGCDLNLNTPSWNSDAHKPVYAIADGVVTCAREFAVWGAIIVIDHGVASDGKPLFSRYAHVEQMELFVKQGDQVKRGQQIARVGNAGGVQPYHLHFDISRTEVLRTKPSDWPGVILARVYRDYVDPVQFFADFGEETVDSEPTPDPDPVTMYITEDGVRVRSLPSVKGTILDQVPAGTEVRAIPKPITDPASKYHFYRIASGVGYIASEFLTSTKPAPKPQTRTMWVNTAVGVNLLVRTEPRLTGIVVDRLPRGTEIQVTGNPIRDLTNNVDYIQISGEKRYVAYNYLSATPVPKVPVTTPTTPATPAWMPRYDQLGIHANAGGWAPDPAQLDTIRRNNIKTVLIVAYQAGQADRAVRLFRSVGVENFVIRAAVTGDIPGTPQNFIQRTIMTLHEYASALGGSQNMLIAVGNEPNLYREGFGSIWKSGTEFAQWYRQVTEFYKENLPGCRIGFPAMSPGGTVTNIRADEAQFLLSARNAGAFAISDWVGVHYYFASPLDEITPPIAKWRQWYGTKPIICTEVGPGDQTVTTNDAAKRVQIKFDTLQIPAMHWLLEGAGAWKGADWTLRGITI